MSTGGIPRFGSLNGQSRRPDVPSGLAAQLGGGAMPTIGGSPQPMQMSAAPMPDMSGGRIPVFGGGSGDLTKLMNAPATSVSSDWGTAPGQRNPYLKENWKDAKNSPETKEYQRQRMYSMMLQTGGVNPQTGKYFPKWGPNGYEGTYWNEFGELPGGLKGTGSGQSAASAAAQKDAEAFIKSLFG